MIQELKYIEDEIEDKIDMICICNLENEIDRILLRTLRVEIKVLYEVKTKLLSIYLDMAHKELKTTKRIGTVSLNRPETGDGDIPF